MKTWIAGFLICCASHGGAVHAQPADKSHYLSDAEEKVWVDAVKGHKTDDGATVLQVLQFVQKLRPREFKFGTITVAYNGASGLPDVVGIEYWLGLKRLPDDAIVNLGFDVRKLDRVFQITPMGWPVSKAIENGRDAFLAAIDEEYADFCIDPETKRHSC